MLEGESPIPITVRHRLMLLMWFTGVLGFAGVLFAQTALPVAPVSDVVDDYFGTKITDPYRWMEDMKSAEFQTWMKAQNDYTRVIIDSIPGRQKRLDSIIEYDNARTSAVDLNKYGDRYFYRKIEPNQDNFKLYRRRTYEARSGLQRSYPLGSARTPLDIGDSHARTEAQQCSASK